MNCSIISSPLRVWKIFLAEDRADDRPLEWRLPVVGRSRNNRNVGGWGPDARIGRGDRAARCAVCDQSAIVIRHEDLCKAELARSMHQPSACDQLFLRPRGSDHVDRQFGSGVAGSRGQRSVDRAPQGSVREDRHHTAGDGAPRDLEPAGDRHREGRRADTDLGEMHAGQFPDWGDGYCRRYICADRRIY